MDTSGDLLVLDTREVADAAVVDSFQKMKSLGEEQRDKFFQERIINHKVPLNGTLAKNNLILFGQHAKKTKSHKEEQLSSLKRDRNLFSTLYIACQVRDTDPEEFFKHENQSFPPSLSDCGNMRHGTKSDLLQCLEDLVPNSAPSQELLQDTDMVVIDGAVIVNMIKPGVADTFNDYASKITGYIRGQFKNSVQRVDMVFDVYKPDSLKGSTRKRRGKGIRVRVEGKKKVPGNWQQFLREDGNKSELFDLLSERVSSEMFPGIVVITSTENVISSQPTNIESLAPCSQEEADTRILLHTADGARKGCKTILIRTVDTDVVVLAVSHANEIGCEQLWISFGSGKSFRYLDVTAISHSLGVEKSKALLAFHALTGCDTTSSFSGRGKRTAWSTWSSFNEVTPALCTISETPSIAMLQEVFATIQRFVVLMYDRGSSEDDVNKARLVLFTEKGREIEGIPPTKDALFQHLLRVGHQAEHVWGQALLKEPHLPSPLEFGWKRKTDSDEWLPIWMTLPPAGQACRAVIKCGCTKACRGKCRCVKEQLRCTSLCKCGGCEQDPN